MRKTIILILLVTSPVCYSQEENYNILYCNDATSSYWRYITFENMYNVDKMLEILVKELKERGFKVISYNDKTHYISSEKELCLNINFTFCVYDSNFNPLLTQPKNTIGFCAHIYSYIIYELPVDIKVYARNKIPQLQEELLSSLKSCKK
ncbi:MAG: hypothetical protein NTY74_03205 [Ignavibacteriae bacterium]|nr:hypothetical protein [Ignavibacteriota bacterium]